MTTKDSETEDVPAETLEALEANVARIEALTQRFLNAISHRRHVPPGLQGPGQDLYVKAVTQYWADMMHNPEKLIEQQVSYWGKTLKHFAEAQSVLAKGQLTAPTDETPTDRRFQNPLWSSHPYFNYIKQQYMLNSEAIATAVAEVDGLTDREKRRLEYFSRQIIDMMSPTNFLPTNPDALEKALETEGESLVQGLENLVRDLEANDGDLVITLADRDAFKVGENLATTPGKVVYRNHLFELIQYAPSTDTVHEVPLLIFPPWINRFYIMDLKPQNSLIKWIVDQGYTVFVVSWVNPDASYRDIGFGDYIEDAYFAAMRETKAICGVDKLNVVGYCIAGTALSITLSLLKQKKDKTVNSATFFTTLTDFSDQGEVGVFLEDDFVDAIEEEATNSGVLDKFYMSRTFSFLRSNDLIYTPAIRSYMMGEAPPAFDLLYWNGDGTNLPGRMTVEYLRGLCQRDEFATSGFDVAGGTARIQDVDVPLCAIACETDHIAAWRSSYRGIQKMGSKDKTFILAQSGHIAGIINPPSKKKYGHYTNPDLTLSPEDWLEGATRHEGTWWPRWNDWLAPRSGGQVPAREPGDSEHPPLADAPGTYVKAGHES